MNVEPGTVYEADCFTLMDSLEPASVDAIITDMPYGTTACSWDTVVDLPTWWAAVKRVLKPRGAFVTTASQPFTSALVMSNPKWFRYSWVWRKNRGGNFVNAHFQPIKEHEDILCFSEQAGQYFPQPTSRADGGKSRAAYLIRPSNTGKRKSVGGFVDKNILDLDPDNRFPSSVIEFVTEVGLHPTQKPVALYEYLIRTYTQPGELVLDPFIGSGTTAIAALNTGRNFIGGDITPEYVEIARRRIANWKRDDHVEVAPGVTQLGLFA